MSFRLKEDEMRVKNAVPALQEALNKGWEKFSADSTDPVGKDMHARLQKRYDDTKEEWYHSSDNGIMTNPQHMELARLIGEQFVEEAAKSGIALAVSFPGVFRKSMEFEDVEPKKLDERSFSLPVYVNGNQAGNIDLDFPHTHEKFGFTEPPQIAFRPLSLELPLKDPKQIYKFNNQDRAR